MVTYYLPLGDCAATDRKNREEKMRYEWLVDAYLQPEMKHRLKYPSNFGKIPGIRLHKKGSGLGALLIDSQSEGITIS